MKGNRAQPISELEVAQALLASIGSPRALAISIMLKYGCYSEILSLRADPLHYRDAQAFRADYAATRLLQKSQWLPTGIDTEAVAMDSFRAAESSCRATNELFDALSEGKACLSPTVAAHLERARRKIAGMLSRFSPYDFLDHCGFGPGSDFSTVGGKTSAYNKLASSGSVTREASIFIDFLASHSSLARKFTWDIGTRSVSAERVPGNRVAFVPKDCKTKRTIAVEPRWNVFLQKGMGAVLRRVLKYHGVDLNDQTLNQRLAREGSITGSLATLDLKSASDTVSRSLVHYMLPPDWAAVLNRLRSPYTRLPSGEWVRLEKWSSMGNGYTFELESLLFFALSGSVCGYGNVSVYGDDLIVPSSLATEVVEVLNACGFTINEAKSFVTGPFRESCGGDYFDGVEVTPLYWKDPLHAEGTLRLANQVTALAARWAGGHYRDSRFRAVWRTLVSRIPNQERFFGPTTVATVIHSPSGKWTKWRAFGWCGWHIRVPVVKAQRFAFRDYDAAVLSQHFAPSTGGYTLRDRTRKKLGTVFVPPGYEDLGPWV